MTLPKDIHVARDDDGTLTLWVGDVPWLVQGRWEMGTLGGEHMTLETTLFADIPPGGCRTWWGGRDVT